MADRVTLSCKTKFEYHQLVSCLQKGFTLGPEAVRYSLNLRVDNKYLSEVSVPDRIKEERFRN